MNRFAIGAMLVAMCLATWVRGQNAPAPEPGALASLRAEAVKLEPFVRSALAKQFLAAVPDLPTIPGLRVVHTNRETREALSAAEAEQRPPEALAGYERRELDERFYYTTRYGTPLAAVRALDLAGAAGLSGVDGKKVLDFGFGSIGQLRLLASLGATVTGIEVDHMLEKLYADPGDTGAIARSKAAAPGEAGHLRLLFGKFPADAKIVDAAGTGYSLFVSKNTLKRGYVHPEREADPRQLVHLEVDDATFVRAVHALLAPGGFMLIYNLSPAPSKPEEKYKPWSDGRSPFARATFESAGFKVLAFDQDDTQAARQMGKLLGWDADMNLDNDLFGTYTLVQKR